MYKFLWPLSDYFTFLAYLFFPDHGLIFIYQLLPMIFLKLFQLIYLIHICLFHFFVSIHFRFVQIVVTVFAIVIFIIKVKWQYKLDRWLDGWMGEFWDGWMDGRMDGFYIWSIVTGHRTRSMCVSWLAMWLECKSRMWSISCGFTAHWHDDCDLGETPLIKLCWALYYSLLPLMWTAHQSAAAVGCQDNVRIQWAYISALCNITKHMLVKL